MRRGCRVPVIPGGRMVGRSLQEERRAHRLIVGAVPAFVGLHLEGWRAVASSIGTGHGSTGYQWRKMAIQGTTGAKFAILPHSIEETGHFAEICDFSQIPYKIGDIFVMI